MKKKKVIHTIQSISELVRAQLRRKEIAEEKLLAAEKAVARSKRQLMKILQAKNGGSIPRAD